MTTYERFKATTLVLLCACLVSVSVAVWNFGETLTATSREVSSTLVTLQATLDSVNGVTSQATITLKTLDQTTKTVGKQATVALRGVVPVLQGFHTTLEAVNRPCSSGRPCGTLADVNKTLSTVRGTFGQIEIAANHETRNLDEFDAQEKQLYADIHLTTTNLNALVASPDIPRFLRASADTSVQVAAIATDIHKEADKLTAPQPWYKKLYQYGNTGVNVACLVTHSCPF